MFLVTIFFFINRLVFSVLSQYIGKSVTFVTFMEHFWYIRFSTHSISGNFLCCCTSIITKPQLYSSKLFCHIGLEADISVYSSLILGVSDLFIFSIISSTYYTIYCVLCLCHFAFFLELDINKYVFCTSSNFDYNQINSYCFLLSEVKFTAFLRH